MDLGSPNAAARHRCTIDVAKDSVGLCHEDGRGIGLLAIRDLTSFDRTSIFALPRIDGDFRTCPVHFASPWF